MQNIIHMFTENFFEKILFQRNGESKLSARRKRKRLPPFLLFLIQGIRFRDCTLGSNMKKTELNNKRWWNSGE